MTPLTIDGVNYLNVDTDDIPSGYTTVPVELDDNGTKYHTVMVAGSVAYNVTSSREAASMISDDSSRTLDTIQPVSGWWMYESKGNGGSTENDGMEEGKGEEYDYMFS
jgi:hypothetical protein